MKKNKSLKKEEEIELKLRMYVLFSAFFFGLIMGGVMFIIWEFDWVLFRVWIVLSIFGGLILWVLSESGVIE